MKISITHLTMDVNSHSMLQSRSNNYQIKSAICYTVCRKLCAEGSSFILVFFSKFVFYSLFQDVFVMGRFAVTPCIEECM